MDKKFIYKMVQNCFKQYRHEFDEIPLTEEDFEELYCKIVEARKNDPDHSLHDIINDLVYEFYTG
ncbi:YqzH family protein (plasmid) [Bacillus sp. 31A1R]|uniref:YqzH family protein n=1 Tax=Robertmurraya mangrovi TaxID=3098077 RepID=A0ABU5IVC0_9BACI|nr:YqzH family protein [Bacillus sp. 31A1R]MDZ5471107.1 YqzH family protein [Bacillus sp. 31A1R]